MLCKKDIHSVSNVCHKHSMEEIGESICAGSPDRATPALSNRYGRIVQNTVLTIQLLIFLCVGIVPGILSLSPLFADTISTQTVEPDTIIETTPDSFTVHDTVTDTFTYPDPALSQPIVQKDTADTKQHGTQIDSVKKVRIQFEIMLLEKAGGPLFTNDTAIVAVNGTAATLNPQSGTFIVSVPAEQKYLLTVKTQRYASYSQSITHAEGKMHYFVTCMLEKKKSPGKLQANKTERDSTTGVPWEIKGVIVDSKVDLPVKPELVYVTFDNKRVEVTENTGFLVSTSWSGEHTFRVRAHGYKDAVQIIELTHDEKQVFIVLPMARLNDTIRHRTITVTANRQKLHETAEASKTTITRKEIQRTTATMNDPMRVIMTLPGVVGESDASARPIVRGGDELEMRATLDGIPLIQPFHFGGLRSTFNLYTLDNISLYKTGFPAEYHNALSAIIAAESRNPTTEDFSGNIDINFMQHALYLGIPLADRKVGLSVSAQGSYYDFMFSRFVNLVNFFIDDTLTREQNNAMIQLTTLPDYQDITFGISYCPNNKFNFFINEMFNTDRIAIKSPEWQIPVKLIYTDTIISFYDTLDYLNSDPYYDWLYKYNLPNKPIMDTILGKRRLIADTMFDYGSRYNVLYGTGTYTPNDYQALSFSAAWQRRWWDLRWPEIDTFSRYDVIISQYNGHFGYLHSGIPKHRLKLGLQADYTRSKYDVKVIRPVHEIIIRGNTNFGDFWGPFTGDSGFVITDSENELIGNFQLQDLGERIFVKYKGFKNFVNLALYAQDEWQITDPFSLEYGLRFEKSTADNAFTFSPRVTAKYSINEKHEIIGSAGHYTQNNYEPAAIALTEFLKPEKVWHGNIGLESRLLPWLDQRIDIYGKYYYDLAVEVVERTNKSDKEMVKEFLNNSTNYLFYYGDTYENQSDSLISALFDRYKDYAVEILEQQYPEIFEDLVQVAAMSGVEYDLSYKSTGTGYASGFEYRIAYEPADFLNGWISFAFGRSFRKRAKGWKSHPFPLDRPLSISIVNYYRLPRKYEIGLKYRYMTGLPYTSTRMDSKIIKIGEYNDRRYAGYHRLDIRVSRGFMLFNAKCQFYNEIWNIQNFANFLLWDKETRTFKSWALNVPFPVPFIGFSAEW